jgi:hypothetical protein
MTTGANRLLLAALFPLRFYAYMTDVPAGRPAALVLPDETADVLSGGPLAA